MWPVTLEFGTPIDKSARPESAASAPPEEPVTSPIHSEPESRLPSPSQSPHGPESKAPVETPTAITPTETEPRVTSPILMFISEPSQRWTSPLCPEPPPRMGSPHPMSNPAPEAQLTPPNRMDPLFNSKPRVLSPIPESRIASPHPEHRVMSPTPEPRVSSPSPVRQVTSFSSSFSLPPVRSPTPVCQVASLTPVPRVTSPAPSDVSEDSDCQGRLWTFCPHGVVIEEIC